MALIDSIIRHFRRKIANRQLTRRLLLELDEVCNACPLPNLLTYVGESAGLGSSTCAAPASRPTSARPRRSTWSRPSATATAGGRSRSGTQAPCRSRPTRARAGRAAGSPFAPCACCTGSRGRAANLPRAALDDDDAGGRAAAADVEGGEAARARDLGVPGAAAHLQRRVEELAHAGRADRVAGADEPAARVDRQLAAGSITPSSIAFQLSPGSVRPKWSMAMYSEVVKQSWVSMPCELPATGSGRRARRRRRSRGACAAARRGRRRSRRSCRRTGRGAVRWPQPRMRGSAASGRPRRRA